METIQESDNQEIVEKIESLVEKNKEKEGLPKWAIYLIMILLLIAVTLTLVYSASALTTCSVAQINSNQMQGQSAPSQTFTCSNSNNNSAVNVLPIGSFYTLSPNTIPSNSSVQISVSFLSSAVIGNNFGTIGFSDNAYPIPVFLIVNSTQLTGCQLNPSTVAYTQAIQQGTKTTIPAITFNPTDCTGTFTLTASSVSIQGGIVTSDGQKPVSISSITPNSINLQIDTTGLGTQQTYTSSLNVNAFNKLFTIPFNIIVTSGTTPPSNVTSSNTPTCSLSSNILNLNSSYSLLCSNLQPDVSVVPEVDSDYIIGTGLETSPTQYIWKFQPIKFGVITMKANFFYRNAPIGSPFKQEVKISSQGLLLPGTVLSFLFTPSLDKAKSGEEVIIQLVDNNSLSLVTSPEIYINARQLIPEGGAFSYKFYSGAEYEIRGRANGYNDLLLNSKLESSIMNLTITPDNADSATQLQIKTSETNASIFIDGIKVSNPYNGALIEGVHEITAIKEGFFDITQNITIKKAVSVTLTTTFKKGDPQIFYLNENASWLVMYQKDSKSGNSLIGNGTGSIIQFTPDKNGIYTISSGDKILYKNELKGFSLYDNGKIFGIQWFYALGGVVALFIIFRLAKSGSSESTTGFAPNIRV